MATLPTTRAARNAMADALGTWLASLTFTKIADASTYQLAKVVARKPAPEDIIVFPSATIVMDAVRIDYRAGSEEVAGSRSPVEGSGQFLQRLGDASAAPRVIIHADSEDGEDEIIGVIERACAPLGELAPRLILTATNHHGVRAVVRLVRVDDLAWSDVRQGVYRPAIMFSMDMPLVRAIDTDDIDPRIDLDIDDATIELQLDAIEETTDDVTGE